MATTRPSKSSVSLSNQLFLAAKRLDSDGHQTLADTWDLEEGEEAGTPHSEVRKMAVSFFIRILKSTVVKSAVVLAKKYGIPLKRVVAMTFFACIDLLTEMDLDPQSLLQYRRRHKGVQVWDLSLTDEDVEEHQDRD